METTKPSFQDVLEFVRCSVVRTNCNVKFRTLRKRSGQPEARPAAGQPERLHQAGDSVEAIQGIIASMKGDYEDRVTITSSKMPSSPKNAAISPKTESYGRNEKRRSEVIPVLFNRVARQPSLLIDSFLCITVIIPSENLSKLATEFFCMQQGKSSATPLLLTALVTNTLCAPAPVTNFSPKIFVPCWLNLLWCYSNNRAIH